MAASAELGVDTVRPPPSAADGLWSRLDLVHRIHHSDSDGPGDIHSPRRGFWYSHQNWIFDSATNPTPLERIPDFARYPELVGLDRWPFVGPLGLLGAGF